MNKLDEILEQFRSGYGLGVTKSEELKFAKKEILELVEDLIPKKYKNAILGIQGVKKESLYRAGWNDCVDLLEKRLEKLEK